MVTILFIDVLEEFIKNHVGDASREQLLWAQEMRKILAVYQEMNIDSSGCIQKTSDALVDLSIQYKPPDRCFFATRPRRKTSFEEMKKLMQLLYEWNIQPEQSRSRPRV